MSRAFFSCLITSLLWAASPAALAIPLIPSQAPQTGLDLSASQWKDSAILREAVALLNRGESQQAKLRLAQFLKQSPNDPRGPELAGMILMAEKNYQVAVVSFKRALALNPNNPAVLAKLGVSLLLQDKKKEGEDALNKAIALRPGEPLARRYLGWLEEGRGNLNGAASHYVAALNGGDLPASELTEIHVALGRIYNALGRHEQTVRLLAPYAARPGTGEIGQVARFQLAFAYLELQRAADAAPLIRSLEKAIKPENPELRLLKAYAQLDSNPAAARGQLQALVKSHPVFAGRARLLIARSHAVGGNAPLAIKELEGLAAQVEKDDLSSVLTALASLQISSGKAAAAASMLETYARKHPDIPRIAYLLAEVRVQTGDIAQAQARLTQLVATYPDYAQAYALLGQIERSRNALPQAEEQLRKAVALDSSLANAWVNLAGIYVSRKDLSKAEAALRQSLVSNPGNAVLQYELASVYDAMGRGKDANPLYLTLLATYPDYVPALNNLAANLADSNELASARKYAEKAYRIDKNHPTLQDTYGWILVLSNEVANGLPLLEQAARSLPRDPTVRYHLGAALLKAGKVEQGKQHLHSALASGLPEPLRKKARALLD